MFVASLTTQERFVLLFLSVTLVIGAAVKVTHAHQAAILSIDTPRVAQEMASFKAVSHQLNTNVSSISSPETKPVDPKKTSTLNINTASTEELQQLPGIGPALANRIVKYREENGPFTQIEDLMQVKGIGNKMYLKISTTISTD